MLGKAIETPKPFDIEYLYHKNILEYNGFRLHQKLL